MSNSWNFHNPNLFIPLTKTLHPIVEVCIAIPISSLGGVPKVLFLLFHF